MESYKETNSERYRRELLNLIHNEGILTGKFTLRSGQESSYYLDMRKVLAFPEGLKNVARLIVGTLVEERIKYTHVGGIETGAIPISTSVALQNECSKPVTFYVRKQIKSHGTSKEIEGCVPTEDSKVLLVEDVLTTGNSVLKAAKTVFFTGAEISCIFCIIDRREELYPYLWSDSLKKNFRLYSLFTLNDLNL